MDLAYVGTLPPHPGGSAVLAAQLLAGFARADHTVRALAPVTAATQAWADAFAARNPGLSIERFELPYYESSPDRPVGEGYRLLEGEQIERRLCALIEAERPDVLLIGRETFALHAGRIARRYELPTVLLVQGGTTYGILHGTLPRETADRLLDEFHKAGRLVAVAAHLAAQLRELGFDGCVGIPNPVDCEKFRPGEKPRDLLARLGIDGKTVVLHPSNLKILKRGLDVVRSAQVVLASESDVVYVVVGDGPDRAAMQEECDRLGVRESFRFVGWVEHDEMPSYLRLADVVVMPSESEALALVYLETQACARVLVASDIAAAREVVDPGRSGLLFPKGDVAALAAETLRAVRDRDLRAAIGAAARASAEAQDLAKAVDAHLAVLREAAGRPASGR